MSSWDPDSTSGASGRAWRRYRPGGGCGTGCCHHRRAAPPRCAPDGHNALCRIEGVRSRDKGRRQRQLRVRFWRRCAPPISSASAFRASPTLSLSAKSSASRSGSLRRHSSTVAEDKRLDAVLGQLDDLKLQLKASQDEVEGLKTRLPTSWMQPVRSAMSLSSRARMSWKLPAPRPAHWRRRSRARLTL